MPDEKDQPKQTPKQPLPANIPVVEIPEIVKNSERMQPLDEEHKDGKFIHVVTKEPYALCVHKPDTYERTHSLKNSAHFWQGTEAEFRAIFEKA